jgi:hypothetical protein
MAPGARLSIYKVLYEAADNSTAQGSDVDIVAAIDAAINDGVDVINFSVGDNVDTFGPDELAFLNAAAAGVFVSAAAGNAGPTPSSVDNAMPWETTVAAARSMRASDDRHARQRKQLPRCRARFMLVCRSPTR